MFFIFSYCGPGYTGRFCETDIDECKVIRSPCGRGHCTNVPGAYTCACEDAAMCGYRCALPDPCDPDPCRNGGVCVSNCTDVPDYFCRCTDGFGGKNCTDTNVSRTLSGCDVYVEELRKASAQLLVV